MTVQLSVDFNLKDKLHGILCSNDLEHYLKDCISCYTVCVIVICLLYQIMNNTVILKFAVCQISLISPMIKNLTNPPHDEWRWGGTTFRFYTGGHRSYEGGHKAHRGDPPTRENPDVMHALWPHGRTEVNFCKRNWQCGFTAPKFRPKANS